MERPVVVNVKDKTQKIDRYVGRPSVFGNPFTIGKDGTREEVVAKYREWVIRHPHVMRRLPELAGKRIGCFCAPKPCHADVLADLVEALPDAH